MAFQQNFNPLGNQRDAIDFVRTMGHLNNQERQNKLLEEQNRLLREGDKNSAKERELESLFQKYKCPCYNRTRPSTLPACKCCGGRKHVQFTKVMEDLGISASQIQRDGSGKDDPSGTMYWERQGIVFVDHYSGEPKRIGGSNTSVHNNTCHVQCPRCNGTGLGGYHCERCEDTGIPLNVRDRYLAERQSIENRYRFRDR